ncbi:MAG: hypothetical protein ABSB49_19885, partial [Polyangia bacterium]
MPGDASPRAGGVAGLARPGTILASSGPAMKKEGGTRILLGSVLKRVYAGMGIVADGAAQVAYYLVFSLFPLLFFLTTLAAYLPIGKAFDAAMDRLRPFLPGQA